MPTGYTSIIDDSEGKATFQEYAWRCARAFGAFVEQRDEPMDGPVKTTFEPSDYHDKAVAAAQAEKKRLLAMKPTATDKAAQAEFEKEMANYHESQERNDRAQRAYEEMAQQVTKWMPPTPEHAGMKKFMLEQLQTGEPGDLRRWWKEPVRKTGDEWRAAKLTQAEKDIAYHTQKHAEEVERTADRNRWVAALVKSLGPPPSSRKQAGKDGA